MQMVGFRLGGNVLGVVVTYCRYSPFFVWHEGADSPV